MSLEQGIEQVKMFQNAIPDLVHNIEEIFAVGDKVILRFIGRGTHTGDIEEMGIHATGKTVEVSSIAIYRIENGKVVEERQEADMLGFMQQLGMELKPKEGEK
jgi:predicted ester cyclase